MYINNEEITVPADITVLEAARMNNINIPTLCYLKDTNEVGACRMCVVEVENKRNLQTACVLPVRENMHVKTLTKRVRESRRHTLELILANHNSDCVSCVRNNTCELQKMSEDFGVEENRYDNEVRDRIYDDLSPSIVRDSSKCILCGRCISVCNEVQQAEVLGFAGRGYETTVEPAFEKSLTDAPCLYCGQCVSACPVGALSEKSEINEVWKALEDDALHVVVQTAPAVRAALGELFNNPIGTRVTGKMVSALRKLGFDMVFDTNFAADLTIMEEGHELLDRVKNGGKLPLITSCSPGWIRFCEYHYPEMLENLSTCKSPQQMFGAVAKSYYAEKMDLNPEDIFVVSIMPCTSKKSERQREEMEVDGIRDVDAVLTTKELAKMIKEAMIDFNKLEDGQTDSILGEFTGAGTIFGATGGVMEAALRTVADVVTGEDLEDIEYKSVRGLEGIKEATVTIGDLDVKAAVAHGTKNARALMERIKNGAEYHFVEVMCCPGGCINGGGQPNVSSTDKEKYDLKTLRAQALYEEDMILKKRKSHENSEVQKLYEEYLEKPNSHKAHELLHTHYHKRKKYHI